MKKSNFLRNDFILIIWTLIFHLIFLVLKLLYLSFHVSVYSFLQSRDDIDIQTTKLWKFNKGRRKGLFQFWQGVSRTGVRRKFQKCWENFKNESEEPIFWKKLKCNIPRRTLVWSQKKTYFEFLGKRSFMDYDILYLRNGYIQLYLETNVSLITSFFHEIVIHKLKMWQQMLQDFQFCLTIMWLLGMERLSRSIKVPMTEVIL